MWEDSPGRPLLERDLHVCKCFFNVLYTNFRHSFPLSIFENNSLSALEYETDQNSSFFGTRCVPVSLTSFIKSSLNAFLVALRGQFLIGSLHGKDNVTSTLMSCLIGECLCGWMVIVNAGPCASLLKSTPEIFLELNRKMKTIKFLTRLFCHNMLKVKWSEIYDYNPYDCTSILTKYAIREEATIPIAWPWLIEIS